MHTMYSRKVLYNRGCSIGHVHIMSVKLKLAWSERDVGELYVQRRLHWTGWTRLHSL